MKLFTQSTHVNEKRWSVIARSSRRPFWHTKHALLYTSLFSLPFCTAAPHFVHMYRLGLLTVSHKFYEASINCSTIWSGVPRSHSYGKNVQILRSRMLAMRHLTMKCNADFVLPKSNSLTSDAAFSPSALSALSMFLDRSTASLSRDVLTAQPISAASNCFCDFLCFFRCLAKWGRVP